MLKLKKIAITGGTASGKTTVCKLLEERGASVVQADAIVHDLLESDTDLREQIIRFLGPEILENGKISRRIIAEKVFNNRKTLEEFEKLLHPEVLHRIEVLYKEACKKGIYTSFVVEIPLLFEIKGEHRYDVVVAVLANEPIAKRRFEQAGFSSTEYDKRMRRQISPSQKAARAHYIIENNGSFEELKKQVDQFIQKLQSGELFLP